MKKVFAILISVISILTICVFSISAFVEEPEASEVSDEEIEDHAHEYETEWNLSVLQDYRWGDLHDIAANADLIVRAVFKENSSVSVSQGMLPWTKAEFDLIDVLKGDFSGDKIDVFYYGGTVSLYDYIQKMIENGDDVSTYNYTDEESKQIGVTYYSEKNAVSFEPGVEYLLCLGATPEYYMVMCESFGTSEVHDGLVTNRFTGEIIPVDDLRG